MEFNDLLNVADGSVRDLLGESVIYTPEDGDPVTVTGIFDAAYVRVDAGQAGVSSSGPAVFLVLDDLPTDPADDEATVTVGGVVYGIREAKPDGKGVVVLLLHKV